jgi:hypothetical protein
MITSCIFSGAALSAPTLYSPQYFQSSYPVSILAPGRETAKNMTSYCLITLAANRTEFKDILNIANCFMQSFA